MPWIHSLCSRYGWADRLLRCLCRWTKRATAAGSPSLRSISMTDREMEEMLDEIFRKVFGDKW